MRLSSISMTAPTVVVGLNAALQKRFILPSGVPLIPGDVHRAMEVQVGVGGKGQDVAVTLSCLQFEGNLQLAQFVGSDPEGEIVYKMLQELLGENAMELTVRPQSGMRTCTSLVASNGTTELVEPSGAVTSQELAQLLERLPSSQARAVCIMGTMPPGCPPETYASIYRIVAGPSTICLIDTVVGLDPLLKTIADRHEGDRGPTVLKINASELCRLSGVRKQSSETGGVELSELVQAIQLFLSKRYPFARKALTSFAITDGGHPAYLAMLPIADEDEFRLFVLPVAKLSNEEQKKQSSWGQWSPRPSNELKPLYPIGAGDAVAAGTLAALVSLTFQESDSSTNALHPDVLTLLTGNENPTTRAILTAFAFGLACGSASCLQEQNSVLKVQDAINLYNKEGRPTFLSSHKMLD